MRSLLDHASVSLKSDDWLSKVVNPHRKHERHKAGIGSLTCYAIGLSEPALDRVDAWRRQTASTCHVRIGQKSPFKIECIWRSSLDEMRMTRTNSDISVKVIRHQRWAAKAFRLTEVAMLRISIFSIKNSAKKPFMSENFEAFMDPLETYVGGE
jgi:hypothetical protein